MQTQTSRHSQPCTESKGPEMFYGYCHDSGRMRMMDYNDYMANMQTGYSNLYTSPVSALQQMVDMVQTPASTSTAPKSHKHHGCGCHEKDDCGCSCCIRCADTVEYARCGETRKIPVTFENDSRRERQVTLDMGSFLTDGGQQLAWKGSLSETSFTLPPCGEKTVTITVSIDCGQTDPTGNNPTSVTGVRDGVSAVDSCKVGYATLKSDGCMIRPLIVAVAVLPDRCGAHHIGCLCGCC